MQRMRARDGRSRWSRGCVCGGRYEMQKQIPFGNDNQKSNGNGKNKDNSVEMAGAVTLLIASIHEFAYRAYQ